MEVCTVCGLAHLREELHGFELVPHPMSPAYQLQEMPWVKILDKAKSMGYTSHHARICGLHIHVSRIALLDELKRADF